MLNTSTINGYENLANAIIIQAAEDYRRALESDNRGTQREIERFFRSDWFIVLTDLNPELLLKRLKQEAKNDNKRILKSGISN